MTITTPLSESNQNVEGLCHLLQKFLAAMAYTPLPLSSYNTEVEEFMAKVMDSRGIRCHQLERTLHLAASLITLCYPDITQEEKTIASLMNWFFIYIDDKVSEDARPFLPFEQRFIRGLPQLDPVLDALVDVLRQVPDKWDDLNANLIIRAGMSFATSCCIETYVHKDFTLVPANANSRFAWFLREGAGVARPFGLYGFTKSQRLGGLDCIQVVPDMEYWICLANDLFSFYKEELNGDTNNYVHVKAKIEKTTVLQVLSDIVDEMVASRDIIHAALADNPQALKTWIATEQGYIQFHLTQKRYKLSDFASLASIFAKLTKSE